MVQAETPAEPSIVPERIEGDVGQAPLPEVPQFELSDPDEQPAPGRGLFELPALRLDLPSTGRRMNTEGAWRVRRPLLQLGFASPPRVDSTLLWPEGTKGPTSIATIYRRPPLIEDDRSAWARWHSTLWGASASVGVLMFTMVATLSLLPRDISGWNKPNFYGLKRTFTSGPSFDYDHYYFNYIFHPYDGSEFYLIARNRDCNWWESFAYAALVSSSFEFLIESAYEGASWQDLWITPVSGAVLGELRWQAKKALEDPSTGKPHGTANKILYVLVDPLDAIFKL